MVVRRGCQNTTRGGNSLTLASATTSTSPIQSGWFDANTTLHWTEKDRGHNTTLDREGQGTQGAMLDVATRVFLFPPLTHMNSTTCDYPPIYSLPPPPPYLPFSSSPSLPSSSPISPFLLPHLSLPPPPHLSLLPPPPPHLSLPPPPPPS